MVKLISVLSAVFWLAAQNASAAEAIFKVVNQHGEPLSDAVITAVTGESTPPPPAFDWPNEMAQENRQFSPFVLIAPKGGAVSFPNRDAFRHHVYSFSTGNKFELELYGKEASRSVTFGNEGVVAVGCNIHDDMIGFIKVVDTPYAAQTGADGRAHLSLPDVDATVSVWHPDIKKETVTVSIGPSTVTEGEHLVVLETK